MGSMDIDRPNARRRWLWRGVAWGVVLGLPLTAGTVAFERLRNAPPTLNRTVLWIDSVKRGRFVREIRGSGSLVPEQSHLLVAESEGVVAKLLLEPGAAVEPGHPILELVNAELGQRMHEAELALRAAEADLLDLSSKLRSNVLGQAAAVATAAGELWRAEAERKANEALIAGGTVPLLAVEQSRARARELRTRRRIEKQRLTMARESLRNQVAAQEARIQQLRLAHDLRKRQVESLQVRAPISGVLQQISAELGQRVAAGTPLAKIADPTRLRAEIKVAETQAKDIRPEQPATVDTHNGIVKGSVMRIDPAAQNGSITVVIVLAGPLPAGARPDLSVESAIITEVAENALYVGRPPLAEPGANLGLYKLEGPHLARRVPVRIGRVSVSEVEISGSLDAGDQVILSDMSAWERYPALRLE
jgi:HlyD family secretion protein